VYGNESRRLTGHDRGNSNELSGSGRSYSEEQEDEHGNGTSRSEEGRCSDGGGESSGNLGRGERVGKVGEGGVGRENDGRESESRRESEGDGQPGGSSAE
jgi:hypothetical protein